MSDATRSVVLISTPSLDPSVNVSGVATVVRGIIESCDEHSWDFRTVMIGKSDNRRRGIAWAFDQLSVAFRFMGAVFYQRPQIIHINGPLNSLAVLRDTVLLILSRLYSRNVVYHLHGGSYVLVKPQSRLLHLVISGMLSLPALVLVLGEQEAESITRLYSVNRVRIRVLPNAVTAPQPMRKHESSGPLRVVSLGRLSPEKGLDVLCATFEQNPDLRNEVILHMYGAGPQEQELLPRLEAALGSSFVFGGVANKTERDAAYAWADVLVMPSLHGEGLPMVLLEAMSMGVVPIATDDGMIQNVVSDDDTGFIIAKSSTLALNNALKRALRAKASGNLGSMSCRAHNMIARHHSLKSYACELEGFYNHLGS